MKWIVFNRRDGGVTVCKPTVESLTWMSCGGIWDDRPRGFMDRQIDSMINRGIKPDAARRFAHAVQFGGLTTAEALEVIRDRSCPGFAHEVWDSSEVPTDRWFRDAWRRSHNGGPISVNLDLAKPIQLPHIAQAIERENKPRADALLEPIEFDRDR